MGDRRPDALAFALARLHPIQRPGIHHHAIAGIGLGHRRAIQFFTFGLHHCNNRQLKLAGKVKVPLVMGRNRHNRAGAVVHHHVVRRPDGNLSPIDRIDRIAAGPNTGFLAALCRAIDGAHAGSGGLVGGDRLFLLRRGQGINLRMLRRNHHKRRAPKRIGTGGVDL